MSDRPPLSPEEWAKVNDLFHRALRLPSSDRTTFLAEHCSQPRLQSEVTTLLAAHERATGFMERPAASPWAESGADDPLVGRTVGHYEVTRRIGAGGMGVVYEAKDTRLGRVVALKALAPQFTHDPSRRERLKREAQATAGLNHPGIATVFALEQIDSEMYLVTEFVPGETLRDQLARGPLPLHRVLDVGVAVARALAAAHDHGVIHRDLKPENVMAVPGGGVKILDFGLARLRNQTSAGPALTGDGTILGTPAYMSPEQIRGQAVEGRSDVFALGVLLFELATGRHPFAGSDSASTLALILEADPHPWPDLTASGSVRPELRDLAEIVRRCLQKRPEDRYSSAESIAESLEYLRRGSDASWAPRPMMPVLAAAAFWWWKFHQVSTSAIYALVLVPLWFSHHWLPDATSLTLFLAGAMAVATAIVLRLHLLFTASTLPSEFARQRAHARLWLRVSDAAVVGVLATAGARLLPSRATVGVVLIAAATVILLAATVIEPATSRAALGDHTAEEAG